jgi:hypothetical protein
VDEVSMATEIIATHDLVVVHVDTEQLRLRNGRKLLDFVEGKVNTLEVLHRHGIVIEERNVRDLVVVCLQ